MHFETSLSLQIPVTLI